MTVQKHTQRMYDKYGHEYMQTRKEKKPKRAYNEYLEVPAMINAVGNIKGKKLLDIGCGAGVHIKKYFKKGAKCSGIDLSKTMIELAKKTCPKINFKVGSITKLPYKSNSFDIVTASLCIDYIKDLNIVFKEICRVLKKGGLFYYSNESPISSAREQFENKKFKIMGIGKFIDKSTGKQIALGQAWNERLAEWEMVPGMTMKTYNKTFRTQLLAIVGNKMELVDFIDCKPTLGFKKIDAKAYEVFSKFPIFSIFIAKKK